MSSNQRHIHDVHFAAASEEAAVQVQAIGEEYQESYDSECGMQGIPSCCGHCSVSSIFSKNILPLPLPSSMTSKYDRSKGTSNVITSLFQNTLSPKKVELFLDHFFEKDMKVQI
jgi:hypothetical protein